MRDDRSTSGTKRDEEFERAKTAAASGDPVGAAAALRRSALLVGVVRDMRRRWQRLPEADVEVVVAEAVESFYFSLREGEEIANIGGFVWRAAHNGAKKVYESRLRERAKVKESEHVYEGASPPAHDESIWQEAEAEETDREEMRARAISTTRSLLPRLGQRNVQSVMEYVLEVIEAEPERIEIPNSELADALGLTVDVAKKSKSRGFQRLERIVKEEGLAEEGFSFSELVPIDDEEEG